MYKPQPDHSMYYMAVVCPTVVNEKIQQYKEWMRDRFGCTVALKSAAHITLIPPFWLENKKENDLIDTLKSFHSPTTAFPVSLNGFSHFSNRVIFIAVEENHQLGALRKATEDHFIIPFHDSIKPDDRPFHPHVTIANRDIKPGDFSKAWGHFAQKKFQPVFEANTVSLLKLNPGKWQLIAERKFSS